MLLYKLAVVLTVLTVCISGYEKTLKVVNVIFRHGDRAPTKQLPIDAVNESFWQYGYGELTDIGKAQHYRLGKLFRGRYSDFLKDKFDYREINIRSSDYDRCLISAYSNLAGLYSNGTEERDVKLPYMTWQPLPVHTVPVAVDEVLAMGEPCVKVRDSQKTLFSSDVVLQINKDYDNLFSFLSGKSGIDLTTNGLRDMWMLYDTLFCESRHNISLPDYTQLTNFTCNNNQIIPCKNRTVWEILVAMGDYEFFLMFNSSTLHKFDGGPLLTDIVDKFHDFIEGNRSIKYNIYSGHDTTVAAVLSALGVFDHKQPQYTATVIIELHSIPGKVGEHEVKVFYKNVTDEPGTHQLNLPGCVSPCTLEKFNDFVSQYKITDWDTECGNTKPDNHTTKGLRKEDIILIAACATVVLVLIIGNILYCLRRRRASRNYLTMN